MSTYVQPAVRPTDKWYVVVDASATGGVNSSEKQYKNGDFGTTYPTDGLVKWEYYDGGGWIIARGFEATEAEAQKKCDEFGSKFPDSWE